MLGVGKCNKKKEKYCRMRGPMTAAWNITILRRVVRTNSLKRCHLGKGLMEGRIYPLSLSGRKTSPNNDESMSVAWLGVCWCNQGTAGRQSSWYKASRRESCSKWKQRAVGARSYGPWWPLWGLRLLLWGNLRDFVERNQLIWLEF